MTEYEFDTPEALLLNVNGRWLDKVSSVTAEAMRHTFSYHFQIRSLLVDQYGNPMPRTHEPKIGETLTIRMPQRFSNQAAEQMQASRMQQEAQDAAHKRLLEEYGPEGLIGQQ